MFLLTMFSTACQKHLTKKIILLIRLTIMALLNLQVKSLQLKKIDESIIIRTAWVYSEFGNNFVKTMMRLMKDRKEIGVVYDQVGTPTYASDLRGAILGYY